MCMWFLLCVCVCLCVHACSQACTCVPVQKFCFDCVLVLCFVTGCVHAPILEKQHVKEYLYCHHHCCLLIFLLLLLPLLSVLLLSSSFCSILFGFFCCSHCCFLHFLFLLILCIDSPPLSPHSVYINTVYTF